MFINFNSFNINGNEEVPERKIEKEKLFPDEQSDDDIGVLNVKDGLNEKLLKNEDNEGKNKYKRKRKSTLEREEEAMVKNYLSKKNLMFEQKKISIFRLIYHLGTKYEFFLMGIGIFTSLFSGLGGPLIAVLFGGTINNFSNTQSQIPEGGGQEEIIKKLEEATNRSLSNFILAGAGMFISGFIRGFSWDYSCLRLIYHLKEKYFKIILKQEQGWFDQNNPFEFSTKVQAQLEQIEMGIGEPFGHLFQTVTQLIAGLIVSFYTSWKLTLIMFSISPIIFGFFIFLFKKIRTKIILSRKTYEKAGGIAEELLYNIKTVASFANYDFENNRFEELIDRVQYFQCDISYKFGFVIFFVFIFINLIFVISVMYGRKLIINKEWNNTTGDYFKAGDILTVIMSSISAIASIGGIGPNLKIIKESSSASSDYFTLLERVPQIDLVQSLYKTNRNDIKGKIEFKNVSFTYPSDINKRKILDKINLTFEPGKQIALVGESGCGKSTIVNLIERLYEPENDGGEILVDGVNIKNYDIKFLRSLIGYVQQEPVLFNKSIEENLIFGREELLNSIGDKMKLIEKACDDSFANEFIQQNNEKYNYIVGIKGSKLSGGQKQRIAIARAILCQPKILILDEATSALDTQSEKEVQKALDHIGKQGNNITTIIIAHRLSTIKNADLIYVIKDGNICESGTHQELLSKNGYYSNLIKAQTGNNLNLESNSGKNKNIDNEKDKNKLYDSDENDSSTNISNTKINSTDNELFIKTDVEKLKEIPNNKTQNNENKVVSVDAKRLLNLLVNDKKKLIIALVASVLGGGVSPITGFLFANYIASLSKVDLQKMLDDFYYWSWLIVIFAICNGFLSFVKMWQFQTIGSIITSKMRKKVIAKYLELHMAFYDLEKNSPGSLLTKLSLDTTQLSNLILSVYGEMIGVIGTCLIGISLGFYYSWRLTLIEFCFVPLTVLSQVMRRKTRRGGRKKERKVDIEAGAVLSEYVTNTKTIFSFGFEDNAVKEYLSILEYQKQNFFRDAFLRSFLVGITGFINFISCFVVFRFAFRFIKEGKLNFRDMIVTMGVVFMLGGGISNGLSGLVDYNKTKSAFISIFETLDIKSEIDVTKEGNISKTSANGILGKIEFKNVSFSYPTKANIPVLKNISFEINPGQSAAIVGYSGSGKSTIIQLLERFYDVTEGEILIDGVNIKEYNLIELRKKIGLVLQEPVLFKRNIMENIRYGNLTSNDEEVKSAANKAKIMNVFKDYEIENKEDPVSGGEKQRIAIARAFLKNPIILLLDEATSALDKETEIEVQKSIEELQKGRTSIVVAHRLSTIEKSDIIFVLEAGKIVEIGTHEELMKLNGKYTSLYQ